MITAAEIKRIYWHLAIPSNEILSGVKRHLNRANLADLQLLCRYFNCSVNNITERFWQAVKKKKYKEIE